MSKTIKMINNGEVVYKNVTISEIMVMFDGMYNEFAHRCVSGLGGYDDSRDAFEDYKQVAMMKAMYVFEKYDIERNACFTKALFEGFKNQFIDLIKEKEAIKRKVEKPMVYLNAEADNGEEISNVIKDSEPDEYFVVDATELEKFLITNLTKEQMMFYTMDLKKQVGKASNIQKSCIGHMIDTFALVIGQTPDKKEDLAILLGLSRPTLNKRIKEAVLKVRELAEEFCLSNMSLAEIPF